MSTYIKAGLSHCINKTLQERVCSLPNLSGCSYSSRIWAPFPSQWQSRGDQPEALCPDMECSAILSPPVPAHVLLKLLGSPRGALARPWPTGTDTAVELLELVFPLFHCLLSWYIIHRRGEHCKYHCTSHCQTLPPLRKQEGQAQDKIFSHSCGCQDLKHLSCSTWEMNL